MRWVRFWEEERYYMRRIRGSKEKKGTLVRNFEIFIHSEDEFYQNELNRKVKNLKKNHSENTQICVFMRIWGMKF